MKPGGENRRFEKCILIKPFKTRISHLLSGLPDPFAKVVVDGSGQCHSTDTVRNTLDPKWNQHYDL
uniref:C2 domain-containing protein n=1 Tax=Cyprinodon variegatus TaxID=28743 RepID=A0A3Q2CVH3_CYPVA